MIWVMEKAPFCWIRWGNLIRQSAAYAVTIIGLEVKARKLQPESRKALFLNSLESQG